MSHPDDVGNKPKPRPFGRCDHGQGYLFARPMPAEQMSTQLGELARTTAPPAASGTSPASICLTRLLHSGGSGRAAPGDGAGHPGQERPPSCRPAFIDSADDPRSRVRSSLLALARCNRRRAL